MNSKLTLAKYSILIALFSIATIVKEVKCYKILGLSISPIKSHFLIFNALMNGLAEDGNEVTFLTPFQSYDSAKTVRHIRYGLPSNAQNSKGKRIKHLHIEFEMTNSHFYTCTNRSIGTE